MPRGFRADIQERYGNWNIIEELPSRKVSGGTKRVVLAKCDCGNERTIDLSSLRYGHSVMCASCANKERSTTHGKTYSKEYAMLRGARHRAKKRGLECTITVEDIVIPSECPVLGIPLYPSSGSCYTGYNSPTIDRIDSTLGYTKDNIRVISWRANSLKKDATLYEIRKVLSYMENPHGE